MPTVRNATALIDVDRLRYEIKHKYEQVAEHPGMGFHFHTGRPLARMLNYPAEIVDSFPEPVIESFAGVNNPFLAGELSPGERVVELGSGAGFDAIIAARQVGATGSVLGIDMTEAMLEKARDNARRMGLTNVRFNQGVVEDIPVADGSVDVVISNGVINLCPDKDAVFREIMRMLRPGGRVQIADVIVQKPVPPAAQEDIDLWTG